MWPSFKNCAFAFVSPNFCWRKTETLLGARDRNLADKWIPAICRNLPLCAETPPSQTEVILMDSEVKGNPNPHVPPTQVSSPTADAWWELCLDIKSVGMGRWREMGKAKQGKTCRGKAKGNIIMQLLSPSATFNFTLYIKEVKARVLNSPLSSAQYFLSAALWGRPLFKNTEFGYTQVCQNLAPAWAEVSTKQISLPRTTELWEDNHTSWGLLWKGRGWWHSLSHHNKMKINDWKPEPQPNGRSLQTTVCTKLQAQSALSPHARSLWDLLCDDMYEGVRAYSLPKEAPDRGTSTFWKCRLVWPPYCQRAIRVM